MNMDIIPGRPSNKPVELNQFYDLEKRSPRMYQLVTEAHFSESSRRRLYWQNNGVDGGEIGITPAMAGFVDEPTSFDGGEI